MEDFKKLIAGDKPTLVDFYATWCGPCRVQATILEDVRKALGGTAGIVKVDIDADSGLAAQYMVQSVPTLILFKNGEPLWRASGVHQADALLRVVREHTGP